MVSMIGMDEHNSINSYTFERGTDRQWHTQNPDKEWRVRWVQGVETLLQTHIVLQVRPSVGDINAFFRST